MSLPGRIVRKARAQLRREAFKEFAALEAARRTHYANLFQEIAQKAGVDLQQIEAESKRRREVERRRYERASKTLAQRYDKTFRDSRDELNAWIDGYMENIIPVFRKIQGNPILWSTHPVEVIINSDPNTPGMSGGSGRHERAFWTSSCTYDLDPRVGNRTNLFHPYLLVDNRDDQHTHTSSWIEIVLRYEIQPPEGDWFLGERFWAPVLGRGHETFFEGWLSCSDRFPILNAVGCYWETIRYDVSIDQPGQNYTNYDLSDPSDPDKEYVAVHTRPFCGGLDGGLYMFTTEPIVYSDIGAFMYDIPGLLLRGTNQGGRPLTVEVKLHFSIGVYYEREMHEIDFREPDFLNFPWVMIYGRRVDL
jgi:hypothetical protein